MSDADARIIETLKNVGLYDALQRHVAKDMTAGDVHVATSLGNDKPRRPRALSFADALAEGGEGVRITGGLPSVEISSTPAHKRLDVLLAKAVAQQPAAVRVAPPAIAEPVAQARELKMIDDKVAHTPFAYDPDAMSRLRADQVPRFLGAITDQDKLPTATVAMDSLRAIQNRVDPVKIKEMQEANGGAGPGKLPVVVRFAGADYIADGHHRLSAQWLNGEAQAQVKFKDLTEVSNALKSATHTPRAETAPPPAPTLTGAGGDGRPLDWSIPFAFAKADPDQRLVFGWASIVEKDGQILIDKQDDMIRPVVLEKAAYDYVLFSREMDDMHTVDVTARLVESMVFTREKQERLGIHGMLKNDAGEVINTGWWAGWYVDSDELWAAIKRGERPEFSIGGSSKRIEV